MRPLISACRGTSVNTIELGEDDSVSVTSLDDPIADSLSDESSLFEMGLLLATYSRSIDGDSSFDSSSLISCKASSRSLQGMDGIAASKIFISLLGLFPCPPRGKIGQFCRDSSCD